MSCRAEGLRREDGAGSGPKAVAGAGAADGRPSGEIAPGASLSKAFVTNEAKWTPPSFVKPFGVSGSVPRASRSAGERPRDGPVEGVTGRG